MRNFLKTHHCEANFGPDDLDIMSAALDAAFEIMRESGNGSPAIRERLATRVLEVFALGERNPRRLRDNAVLYLTEIGLKPLRK